MKFLLSLLALLLSSIGLFGQKQDMVSFTIDDGMQNGSVQSMVKGSDGYVYIGTFTGITRYDGKNAVNIRISEHDDGKYNITYDIIEVANHQFYVGNTQGLWLFDAANLTVKRLFKEQINSKVVAIKRFGRNYFVATANGLFKIDEQGKLVIVALYKQNKFNDSNTLDIDVVATADGGRLWTLTANGLIDIDIKRNDGGIFYPFSSVLQPTAIAITRQGTVAIGTADAGLWMYSPKDKRLWFSAFVSQTINNLQLADNGNLLVATNKSGAVEMNPVTGMIVKTYSDKESSATVRTRFNDVQVFYRDDAGIDWIGYKFYGLEHTLYNSGVFKMYDMPDGTDLENAHVVCSFVDGNKLLIGTRNGLFLVEENTGKVRYFGEKKLGASFVSAITKCGDDYVIGTSGNILVLINSTSYEVSRVVTERLRPSLVFKIKHDGMGNLWICTSDGLVRMDMKTHDIKLFDTTNSQLPDKEVYCIDFDLGGRGWVSTRGGNCVYLPTINAISVKNIPKKIADTGALRDIQRLEDGRMLFLPQRGFPIVADANVVKMTTWKYDVGEEAPNISFFVYHDGTCYFSTDNGFHVYESGKLHSYGYIDGLHSMEFQRSCVVAPDGRCLIATNKGLAITTLAKLDKAGHRRRIPIVLTQIQTDRWLTDAEVATVVAQRKINLERSVKGMSIQFKALAYATDDKMQYAYILDGYDKKWTLADANNTAFYRSLPCGTYHLRIRVLGNEDVYGEYEVYVPMAYSTMAIYAIVIFLLLFAIYIMWCKYTKKEYFWKRIMMKPEPEKYQASKLQKAEAEKVVKKLCRYVEQQKPYLNSELTMTDLAKALGVSNHTLSQIFTQHMHRNYYDFIAEYRVAEFKRLVTLPEYSKFTIMAIAEKCGFKSRTSFFTAFKNHTGCTPKEYMEKKAL